jgi:hypothetical protein
MGLIGRLVLFGVGILSLTFLGIVYAKGFAPIRNIAEGFEQGPFMSIIPLVDTAVSLIIGVLLLFLIVYLMFGGILRERTRERRPPR